MLKGEVRITIGGFDGFTQMMGHCYADCYSFPFSLFRSEQVCDALPEGVCPVGDVQVEGFLYLCLVQDGVGGALHGRGVLTAQAGTYAAMALLCAERVGRLLYHLREVVPGADTEVGIVVDAAFGIGGERPLPIQSARRTGKFSPPKAQKHIRCFF